MDFAIESGATYIVSTTLLLFFSAGAYAAFVISLDEPTKVRR